MASSSGPPRHHDEPVHGRERERESTSSTAAATSADDSIAAAAEGSPEETGGGGGGGGRSGSAAAAVDQGGKEKVVEGSQEATKKNKVDSPLKKFIRRSILAVSEGFKKKIDKESNRMGQAHQTRHLMWITRKFPWEKLCIIILGTFIMLSKRERESAIIARLVPLHGHYSALRPVHRDGESFYRSFIFSYLEQIVDRVDTHEEDRLLAAVRELARRAEHFQWASEFSRRRKAFEMLIEKIKGWKCMSQYPTLKVRSLERLAASIWMCSPDHRAMYAPGVIGPGEGRSLEDWCSTQVIPPRVHADEVAVRALAAALQVFVRVETPEYGGRQDSYYIARDRPRVTLLCIDSQYDIVYPLSPESIHRRAKRGGLGGASWLHCCIGRGDPLRPVRQQQLGGGRRQRPDPAAGTSSRGGADQREEDPAGQEGARASWFRCCRCRDPRKDQEEEAGHGPGQRKLPESTSAATDDTIAAAAEGSPEQTGGGDGSGSAAPAGDQKGKGKVVEEAAKKNKVDSQLKKFIRRSFLVFSEGFKKKLSDRQGKQLDGASTSNSPPHVDHKEQIVDRVDTCEEDRLLAAVRELARRAEHFQWASEFSRRRHAFEMLIEKIKGWKHMLQYPTLRVRFLKRLAAAIWMCSPDHRGMYAPGVIGPGDGRSLENWCSTQVIPPRVYADEVAVRALAAALQVFIRVEMLEHGGRQDSYYIARDRPHVTLLCMDSQYDIAYPLSAESIHRRVKQGGVGGASRFNCCIGGDSNLQRLSQQQEQRGGGGQQHPDRAGSSSQGAGASWFHSCAGGSKKKQSSADEADIHGHGRGQLRREHQGSRAAASSTDASSSAAAAHGGANVPPPPPSSADRLTQQPGGTDGSSAAADQKGKKPISASDDRKQLSDRKREQSNCPGQNSGASMSIPVPHVYYKKLPMGDALYYYFTNFEDALQQPKVGVRLKFLDRDYSEFRPVVPDGECFYRSFIFSYLEQVVDRIDTRWEDRLLAAVRELDRQAEHFQWASELSRRREVFERLIAKIKGWKRMRDYPPSRVSYNNGEFLLELFNSYESKNHTTWMCTHKGKYGRHVREGRSLEDWCSTQVIPPGVETYLIVIRALAEALRVAVRVENVNNGTTENTHYNIVHGTPQVTLLRIESSCDIIYPLPPSATGHPNQPKPLHGRGSQQHPDPAAETSSQGAARAGFWWFDCCFVVPKESLSQGPKESYPFPPSATGRPNQPRPLHGRGSQQHPDPAAETSSQGAAKAGFWWFDCCFVVLKENLSQGSTASARSGHELQSRPSRTQPKQIPH
uniref:OTU domain-containing protein n=1 Tax=Oryza punctata TaxID=4537 RepID=A0A0E0K0D6_ORYPU